MVPVTRAAGVARAARIEGGSRLSAAAPPASLRKSRRFEETKALLRSWAGTASCRREAHQRADRRLQDRGTAVSVASHALEIATRVVAAIQHDDRRGVAWRAGCVACMPA